jgi:hypothetical protein
MVTTIILRRGGALRIAALVVLAASILSFGAGQPTSVRAHDGDGWCDIWSTPVAQFLGMFDDWEFYPGAHYHKWNVYGVGIRNELCYLIY